MKHEESTSVRHYLASLTRAGMTSAIVGVSLGLSMTSILAEESAAQKSQADNTGVWKYHVPNKNVKGELDNYDPIGLIAGALIKTDCSYNWRDEAGKLYCFATPTSLGYFENWPKTNIERATEAWHRLTTPGS
jgi:hypothetical protein